MKVWLKGCLALAWVAAPVVGWAAPERSLSPYIDQLKQELEENAPSEPKTSDQPYIDSIKKKLEAENPEYDLGEGYTDRIRKGDPERFQKSVEESYSETERAKIEPAEEGGAIQAVAEGRSELEMKKPGKIRFAFGMRYGAALTRGFSAAPSVAGASFKDVYGDNYAPDLSFFFEFQPFHSEWFGNVGVVAMGGMSYFHGQGRFALPVPKPGGVGFFPQSSRTLFEFFMLPATVGLNYRFNLLRVLRPYVMVGPTVVGYVEKRNDGINANRGASTSLLATGGVSILLDWMSPKGAWDLYSSIGVKHYYLTVEYSNMTPLAGNVSFAMNGVYAGLTFEY